MILDTMQIIESNMLPLNFVSHAIIFLGGFYIALHSRLLPTWIVTSLWYIGLFSLIICGTIVAQWHFGPDFILSYHNVGTITETMFNMAMAVTVAVCFSDTVLKDFKGMKSRKKREEFKI